MGSCISKVLGLATPTQKDPDEAWKRQTLGGKENKLYTFVDLKGSTTNTELVEIWKKHGKEGFLRKLRDNEILSPYLYDNGMGKDVTAEEVKQWREETVPEFDKNQYELEHVPYKACWKLHHRGTLGETALHLCFCVMMQR